ncbi:class I adenylate-forming enzyme family protein [Kitasatospora sp. NPDC015120]|uniref:class I adenylate-forming enzyme family protein n=1 Tax=Kitasatospora sp. NPDC015120 TaxID=3364023 RepID=UPI0036F46128
MSAAQNEALYIGDLFAMGASEHPNSRMTLDHRLALFPESGTSVTYRRLADHVEEVSARLAAAEIRAGEQVFLFASNTFDLVLTACALSRLGAVPLLLSPKLDGDVVAQLLTKTDEPAVLLTDPATLRGALDGVDVTAATSRVLLLTGEADGHESLDRHAGAPRRAAVRTEPDAPCLATHTSGTTGLPKLVLQSARSLWWHLKPQLRTAKIMRAREARAICVSLVHARIWPLLYIVISRGQHTVVLTDPDPRKAADLLSETRPGLLEAHPNILIQWEALADDPRGPLANVRYFINTFDAMHPRTIRILLGASRRRMPVYVQGYGQSETGPVCLRPYTRRLARTADGRCLGFPFKGVTEVRIGEPLADASGPEKVGPLLVRTHGHSVGIIGGAEQFAQRFAGGWWRMGDLGYRSRWGCVHLLDREIDHIDGVTSSLQVEDVLMERLPELTEVVLVEGKDGNPVPVVATHGDRPLGTAAWQRAVAGLPGMAEPLHSPWHALPMTSTWKVRRQLLGAMVADGSLPLVGSPDQGRAERLT